MIHYSSSNTEPLQGPLSVAGFVICQSRATPESLLAAFKGTTFTASLLNNDFHMRPHRGLNTEREGGEECEEGEKYLLKI